MQIHRTACHKIRTLVVDDSIFFRTFLERSFLDHPHIEIVGTAADAFEAEKKLATIIPDVITLDMEMPGMRGPEFLCKILPRYPQIKVVVISSIPQNVFEALHAGAVDFIAKPDSIFGDKQAPFIEEVAAKIQIAYESSGVQPGAVTANPLTVDVPARMTMDTEAVIAIGASTGGTEAIATVLRELPETAPGVVIVQHMPPVFTAMFAERLDKIARIEVREAVEGDRLRPGLALLAMGDKQMTLCRDRQGYYIHYVGSHKVSGHCPSVDVLFASVAQVAKDRAMGIILTGMGADGARGLLDMRQAGAYTVGQNEATCVVYGMPMAAYKKGAVVSQLPLEAIGSDVVRWASVDTVNS